MVAISRSTLGYVGVGLLVGLIAGIIATAVPTPHPAVTVLLAVAVLGVGLLGVQKLQ